MEKYLVGTSCGGYPPFLVFTKETAMWYINNYMLVWVVDLSTDRFLNSDGSLGEFV